MLFQVSYLISYNLVNLYISNSRTDPSLFNQNEQTMLGRVKQTLFTWFSFCNIIVSVQSFLLLRFILFGQMVKIILSSAKNRRKTVKITNVWETETVSYTILYSEGNLDSTIRNQPCLTICQTRDQIEKLADFLVYRIFMQSKGEDLVK